MIPRLGMVTKTVLYWHEDIQRDQWNKIKRTRNKTLCVCVCECVWVV